MEDKLDEVINRSIAKKFVSSPTSEQTLELISLRTFDKSDVQSVRKFQAAIAERFNIDLVVAGGGYGCTKVAFKLEGVSPEEARIQIQKLLESELFREEALKVDFQIAIGRNPDIRVNLKNGVIESLAGGQGLLLFCSYAHEDKEHRNNLEKHLTLLKRQGFIRLWHDQRIMAGENFEDEIDENLGYADVILLLISVDFIASDYCYSKEMARALARHQSGEAQVIPIIVRPVDWETAPFAKLKVLPEDGQAVALWENQDEVWMSIAKEIRMVVVKILNRNPSKKKARAA